MQRQKRFDENLARGLEFEQGDGLAILHKMFPDAWIINNKVDPLVSTGDKEVGPRAYRGANREDQLTLPDYQIINKEGKVSWVDAKSKGATYPDGTRKYFTFDKRVHAKYRAFPKWMNDNLWILFRNDRLNDIYLTRFIMEPEVKYFNNQYGTGQVPIYYIDQLTKIN